MMRSLDSGDRAIGTIVIFATVAYLAALPRYLGWADESYFLYEAKRIRDGEVMYRDIFQFITPLAAYVMALLYWLFGTTIATARVAMAVLHGALCGLLYATARQLAIRRTLALLVPLGFLALCQPTWPFASPHWASTAVTMAVLAVLIWPHGTDGPGSRVPGSGFSDDPGLGTRNSGLLGVLLGLLIGAQQQKGVIIAAAVCGILIADRGLDLRYARPRLQTSLLTSVMDLTMGIVLIVIPLGLFMIASAGIGPVYRALIVFPLDSYRHGHFIRWGATAPLAESFSAATFPVLLRWAPLSALFPLARCIDGVARGREERMTRQLMVLVLVAASSVLSIWYFPDLIHIAFIAPVFLLCAAASIEWFFEVLDGSRPAALFASTVTLGLAAGLAYQLWHTTAAMLQEYTIPHDTAFGRIDFAKPWEPMMVDAVRTLLDDVPGRELFSYPNVTSIYLTTGAHNPTPYQYLLARVSPPAQIADAERILTARRLPYLIVSPMIFMGRDPLATFITERYESAPIQQIVDAGELPAFWLYRRKSE